MPNHTHHDSDRLFLQQAIDQAVCTQRGWTLWRGAGGRG
jgi:hypothetical protein